ncbi:transcriptional activator hap3-like [Cicer arietinum]|uniref:Nuclear transcription factor Y subunit B-3-like n=1 Tax=Cicer arietinum TaxID=3827 RepID=A0A1S2Y2P9_CICAR|nr:nuclear transcription factor Y subunit B-3-like [Cicer arietinum]
MEHGSPSSNHSRKAQSSSDTRKEGKNGAGSEEVHMPIANLAKIMRRALPAQVKISDGAKESMQLCVSEFMGIITTEASQRCKVEHRKIVTAEDLIWAMDRLGFEDYTAPLVLYLDNYRKNEAQITAMAIAHGLNKDASSSGSGNDQP